jgi:hypothetical protein
MAEDTKQISTSDFCSSHNSTFPATRKKSPTTTTTKVKYQAPCSSIIITMARFNFITLLVLAVVTLATSTSALDANAGGLRRAAAVDAAKVNKPVTNGMKKSRGSMQSRRTAAPTVSAAPTRASKASKATSQKSLNKPNKSMSKSMKN